MNNNSCRCYDTIDQPPAKPQKGFCWEAEFFDRLPHRPYCSNDLSHGTKIRGKVEASKHIYIQPNSPVSDSWMIFDIDHPSRDIWLKIQDAKLPVPAWIVWNPLNDHAHVAWGLSVPVVTSDNGRHHPQAFLRRIKGAYAEILGADPDYAGLLTKNPLHPEADRWSPTYKPDLGMYDLAGLAKPLDLSLPVKGTRARGEGRNTTLFDELRAWAYRAIRQGWPSYSRWTEACLNRAEGINRRFASPLPYSELKATAKSVAKFTHREYSETAFRARQARCGHLGGIASGKARSALNEDKRVSAKLMRSKGMTYREIAEELSVSAASVHAWCVK